MNDDLVTCLKAAGRVFVDNQYNLHTRAADRIEELDRYSQHWQDCYTRKVKHEIEVRARIRELEVALHTIVCNTEPKAWRHATYEQLADSVFECARAALGEKKDG
jgi:hypothetical protein